MKKEVIKFAKKQLNKKVMSNKKSDRSRHADTVVQNHVIWAMGASFIPVPVADIFAVSALQLDMIRQICRVYDRDFSESQGKAIVSSLTTSILVKIGTRSLIKLVPVVGTLIGGVTSAIFNGASTYAMGEVFKHHFDMGGTFLDFDTERLKKFYQQKFEKGKKIAEQLHREQEVLQESVETEDGKLETATETEAKLTTKVETEPAAPTAAPVSAQDEVLIKLKELGELRNQGVISEEEFDRMKKELIKKF